MCIHTRAVQSEAIRSSACLVPSFALDLCSPSSVPKTRPPKVSFDFAFHFSRMQRLFSPLLLLLLVAPCCLSWGPFSHVQFGSDALPSPPPSQQQLSSFFAGCVSPDAIKSVNLSLHSLRKRLMYSFCSKGDNLWCRHGRFDDHIGTPSTPLHLL